MSSLRGGAASSPRHAPGLARSVRCDDEFLYVTLHDGRVVPAPLTPRLRTATAEQRARYAIEDDGTAIHWPEIDEDVGVAHVLGISEEELYEFAGWVDEPDD